MKYEYFAGRGLRHAIAGGALYLAVALLLPILASTQSSAQTSREEAAATFVQATVERGLGTLNDRSVPEAQRRQNLRTFLRSFMDIRSVALFSFGIARRTATPAQTEKFVKVFQDYTVALYESLLSKYYAGQSVRVAGCTEDGPDSFIVRIILDNSNAGSQSQSPRIELNVRVIDKGGSFSITDLAFEDMWLSIQERDEVNDYLMGNMGNVGGLIVHYEALTQQKQSESASS
jgi:ABC-type transporter MlaC component